ncbi:hypothetical protein ACQEVF_58870 [Nonomuraea polychroma]|uniref:hypothetical protein n=1 Tax=Nonomuraea polychroma TaxID=46176 RepID=UPI003D913806
MPDQWQVTRIIESSDTSGQIEAWEITIIRPADEESVSLWLPKMAIENTAVAYGLTSTDEAIDVILHYTLLPIYDPHDQEPDPWPVTGEQARAAALKRLERCKRDHATVATAVPEGRTAAARAAADVLAPLRSHVRIDPVTVAAARLEHQRAFLRAGT